MEGNPGEKDVLITTLSITYPPSRSYNINTQALAKNIVDKW